MKMEISKREKKLSKLIESAIRGEGYDMSYGEFKEWLIRIVKGSNRVRLKRIGRFIGSEFEGNMNKIRGLK